MYQEPVTVNQSQFIRVLEEKLGVRFTGTTKNDAARFISLQYPRLRKQRNEGRKYAIEQRKICLL